MLNSIIIAGARTMVASTTTTNHSYCWRSFDKVSAASKAASDAKNTNLAKFINNLESRVYATLSQKIAEQLFTDNGATSGMFDIATNHVQWSSDGSQITLRITDAAGSITEVVVPYGSLAW